MWLLYEILVVIGWLGYLPKALLKKRLPHRGWGMRLGCYSHELRKHLLDKQSIWVHTVSVGEVLSAVPLLRLLSEAFPQYPLVLSVVTPSGFTVASKQKIDRLTPIYFPLDLGFCIRRAFDCLHPKILLLMESELWPGIIRMAKKQETPIVLINGRISPRTFNRYRKVKRWVQGTLNRVDVFLMQSETDAQRLLEIAGVALPVHVAGNLKWDASFKSRPNASAIQQLKSRLGLTDQNIVIVAGSTHRGEEQALLHAFLALQKSLPQLRLIIAPRHLERLSEVEGWIRQEGLEPARLSSLGAQPWKVGLVDTMGELAHYYGLASLAFIGGSLIPHGGQNPLEAASLGKPILFGPFMHNFPDIAQQLLKHQAARQISSMEELFPTLQVLLSDPRRLQTMGQRAQILVEEQGGTALRILQHVTPFLAQPS